MINFIDLSNDSSSSDTENEQDFLSKNTRLSVTTYRRSRMSTSAENIMELDGIKDNEVKTREKRVNDERNHLMDVTYQKSRDGGYSSANRVNPDICSVNICKTRLRKAIRRCGEQKLRIENLRKLNNGWEIDYRELERKYNELVLQLAKANLDRKKLTPSALSQGCTKGNRGEEGIFTIDSTTDMEESSVVSSTVVDEFGDTDMDQIINYEMVLSEKDYEIQRYKKDLRTLEKRFKTKEESERSIKRKLEIMESETERATKRLKAVEEENEKLIDDLESTTLCGFCQENPKDIAFNPCGHIWACSMCVNFANMTECPNC